MASITFPDAPLAPRRQPCFGISPAAYLFDALANLLLAPLYRRAVRRHHGQRMAPVPRAKRRAWFALVLLGLVGLLIGRRRRR